MNKTTSKYIENELYDYDLSVKEYKSLRNEILHQSEHVDQIDENIGAGKTNTVISPIETTVTKLMTDRRLMTLEKTLTAINTIYTECEPKTQKLIELTYWTKPQTLSKYGIAREAGMSESTARRHKNTVIKKIAEQLGLKTS